MNSKIKQNKTKTKDKSNQKQKQNKSDISLSYHDENESSSGRNSFVANRLRERRLLNTCDRIFFLKNKYFSHFLYHLRYLYNLRQPLFEQDLYKYISLGMWIRIFP